MAQNSIKKPTSSLKKTSKRPTASSKPPQRGTRVIAPKKPKLIAKRKLMKRATAGLTAMTEKNLAERAGHLEMLAGGKRERLKVEGQKARAAGTMDRK